MFKKVLVAEDLDGINNAVADVLEKKGIQQIVHAPYCDEAHVKIKRAILDQDPFDLLICDLSFKPDHRTQKLKSGQELISALRKELPDLKIIVNSIEDHPQTVHNLFEEENIQGYVCKNRQGMKHLSDAIDAVARGQSYISPQIELAMKQEQPSGLSSYEKNLLNLLASGLTQDEIIEEFKKQDISPHSKSSIEKHLRELREQFNAKTNPHLISIVKDLKLI